MALIEIHLPHKRYKSSKMLAVTSLRVDFRYDFFGVCEVENCVLSRYLSPG